jgi:L-fuconolactonase
MRVDAHHHLWRYTADEYGWMDDSMASLRRDFLPEDLVEATAASAIDATVAVQARQTLEETHWLLDLARHSSLIRGVVGWAPIASSNFHATLQHLVDQPLLKGLRHVVQAEPEGFLDSPAFNAGIAALAGSDLVYDLLILTPQLPETIRFVDRHPHQIFVLDHLAKPAIAHDGFAVWQSGFRALSQRQNVVCKLSGMVTEADWLDWSPATLTPYLDHALECFGPSRLMFGSDWPVLTVAATYQRWHQTLIEWLAKLSAHERAEIEGDVAVRTYRLNAAQLSGNPL